MVLYVSVYFKNMQTKLIFFNILQPSRTNEFNRPVLHQAQLASLSPHTAKGALRRSNDFPAFAVGNFSMIYALNSVGTRCVVNSDRSFQIRHFFLNRKTIYIYVQRPEAAGSALEEVDVTC